MKITSACTVFLVLRIGMADISDWYQVDFCSEPIWERIHAQLDSTKDLIRSGKIAEATSLLEGIDEEGALTNPAIAFRCSTGAAAVSFTLSNCYEALGMSLRALRLRQVVAIFLSFDFQMKGQERIERSGWSVSWTDSVDSIIRSMEEFITLDPLRTMSMSRLIRQFGETSPKLRVAIVSVCDYDSSATPLAELSLLNKQAYATRHGYDLFYYDKAPEFVDYFTTHGNMDSTRPRAWSKIDAMLKVMLQGAHEWVMWMDCDSFFMDGDVRLEDVVLVGQGHSEQNQLTEDPTVTTERLRKLAEWKPSDGSSLSGFVDEYSNELDAIIQQNNNSVHLIASEDGLMLNTGIFFVRRSAVGFATLLKVRALLFDKSALTFHPWWEQTGMVLLNVLPYALSRTRWDSVSSNEGFATHIRLLSQKQLNTYPPMIAGMMRTHAAYEEGDFIISFSGCKVYTGQSVCNSLFIDYFLHSVGGDQAALSEATLQFMYE